MPHDRVSMSALVPGDNRIQLLWTQRLTEIEATVQALLEGQRGTGAQSARVISGLLRQVQNTLGDSERRFRELLNQIQTVVVFLNAHGRITFCNAFLLALTGYHEEALLGKDWFEQFYPVEKRAAARQLFVDQIKQGLIPRCEESEILTAQGEERTIAWSSMLLRDPDGQVVGSACMGTDITERNYLESQLRQAQKMEAIGQLASGVAHDFNNILMIIIGYSELVLRQLEEDQPLRLPVQEIRQAANRATDLTRQLLTFSRKQTHHPQILALNVVITDLITMLKRLLGEDIEVVTLSDPALGHVKADKGQLEQVLINLAVNARDAMPRGGTFAIETANVVRDEAFFCRQDELPPGPYVLLTVRDTGCGMDEATQKRLFEPFFTTKSPEKGTGLGLATVYGIITQSGGGVQVDSAPGQGTNFMFWLPRSEETLPVAPDAAPGTVSLHGSETVLLVEDEESLRLLARQTLQLAGYTVLETASGETALKLSDRHPGPVHLVVADVVMPRMSGVECVNRLLATRSNLKVLYISGYIEHALLHDDVRESGFPLLMKPFAPDTFLHAIRNVLDGALQC